jgi:hypothetical protein
MAMSHYYHKKKFSDLRGKMVKSGQFDPVYQSGPSKIQKSPSPNPEDEYGPSSSKKRKTESSSSLDSQQVQEAFDLNLAKQLQRKELAESNIYEGTGNLLQ